MTNVCENCIHERICVIWRATECQDASCYIEDCYESAVALPEHHGRLIDADALYKRLLKQQDGHEEELAIGDYVFRSIIAAAPTVIEEA